MIQYKIVVVACKDVYIDTLYTGIYIHIQIHTCTYIQICLVISDWNWTYFSCYASYTLGMDQSSKGEHMPSFNQVIQRLQPIFFLDRWSRLTSRSQLFKVSLKLSKNGSRQDLPDILGFAQAAWKN